MTRILKAIDGHVMAPAPAERLALLRILIGGFAMIYIVARMPYFWSYGHFSPGQFQPIGIVWLLIDQPLSAWAVTATTVATALLSVGFLLGWRMRIVGPLFSLACLWTLTYRSSWGMIFHTENLLVMHVLILSVSASAHSMSLDARRRLRLGGQHAASSSAPHGRYGWPIKLMCWVVVLAYVLAGLAKLQNGGLSWLWGDELRNHVAIDNARKMLLGDMYSPLAAPLMEWGTMWRLLATVTVVLELGAPLALLGRRIGAAWVVSVIGFHLGVLALMMIAFPYQMLGIAFACFFPVERWWQRGRTRWRRWRGQTSDQRPMVVQEEETRERAEVEGGLGTGETGSGV